MQTKHQLDLITQIHKLRTKREMIRQQAALVSRDIQSLKSALAYAVKVGK